MLQRAVGAVGGRRVLERAHGRRVERGVEQQRVEGGSGVREKIGVFAVDVDGISDGRLDLLIMNLRLPVSEMRIKHVID